MNFKKWLEMCGTGAIYDPKVKPKDFNWWGAVGKQAVSPKKGPINASRKHNNKS